MGCSQSKIENEESVARCKERKAFMKEAVGTRNAFAAAHSGYIVSLKNTGAALNDYGQGEATEAPRQGVPQVAPLYSDPLPPAPPPPPLPDFHRSTLPSPLKRALSAPPIQQQPEAKKNPRSPRRLHCRRRRRRGGGGRGGG